MLYQFLVLLGQLCCILTNPAYDEDGYHHKQHEFSGSQAANIDWWVLGEQELLAALNHSPNMGVAKNVIVFVGDGMGVSTQTAARFFKATRDSTHPSATSHSWESMPNVALSKTYNTDKQTPDSAGTATAILSGYKTRSGTVGVNQDVERGDCNAVNETTKLNSILHLAHLKNKWTGIVTTTRVTHATPASAYARCPDRDWESDGSVPTAHRAKCSDIARQLVEENGFIRVVLGGGRTNFLPSTMNDPEYPVVPGLRRDGRNLLQEWLSQRNASGLTEEKYKMVMNLTQFNAVDPNNVDYLFGLFEPSHCQYMVDHSSDSWGEPTLTEMTETAIKILSRSTEGYVLLVEGGRIDHAHHDTNAYRALEETLSLSDAVQAAINLTSQSDTLIVVTADHSHVFTMGGYASLDANVLSVTDDGNADDGMPYGIVTYANGPGFYSHRITNATMTHRNDPTESDPTDIEYQQDAGVPLFSESHGAEEVAIFAQGPFAHLLHGVHEQSYIGHLIIYAACLGDNQSHCSLN